MRAERLPTTPYLNVPTSWYSVGLTDVWHSAAHRYRVGPSKRFYLYNNKRPATGSFATEDDGAALRELVWGRYEKGIDGWFHWRRRAARPQNEIVRLRSAAGHTSPCATGAGRMTMVVF